MPGADSGSAGPAAEFFNATTLGFIAYVMFPTLAVVTAVFGVILLKRDNLAGGLAFFVLLQLWVIGGIIVHNMRKRRAAPQAGETEDQGRPGP